MKSKAILSTVKKIAVAIVAVVLCFLLIPFAGVSKAYAQEDIAPIISLDAAFSDEGMATEIDCAYGTRLTIPNPIAIVNGRRVEAVTTVKYLDADGWEIYELPQDRVLVVGDANSGDENKVAMYVVTFSAQSGDKTTELVYTIYAGLQFSNRTAWASSDAVGFVGEQLTVPTTKIQYKYKNDASKNVIIAIEPIFTLTYFADGDDEGEIIELDGALAFTPERAGRYEAKYATPETVQADGVVFIRGSQSLVRVINVYSERSNPTENADGIYECNFIVGGTSDTGKGMIASSCSSRIQIEKISNLYYMHFTQTAANYMFNLKMTAGGKALGNLIVREEAVGAQNIREYVVTMDEATLKSEIAVSMYIGPMSRDVDFTIKADIDNAYCVSSEVSNEGERPALYVPVIDADSSVIIRILGTAVEIPSVVARLGEEECSVEISVYYSGDERESVEVVNNSFTPDKTGTYYIVYIATSDSYTTSAGNPSKTVFERQVTIGRI
ncbi:MAG: hypothetical protein K2M44_07330 [Clostridia bacterium]|nr:hypothetical protein [Clostridia bacterium]